MALIGSVVLVLVTLGNVMATEDPMPRKLATSLTTAQKNAITARHNKVRSDAATKAITAHASYQPCTAADMEMMVWDDTLATAAQTYADACVGDHHADAGNLFGENLFMTFPSSTYTDSELVSNVQGWYDEIVDTVFGIDDTRITSKPLNQCVDTAGSNCNVGHYYQMVWASSNKIGCGVKSCTSGFMISGSQYNTGFLLVCRYTASARQGNGGASQGLPYMFGTPCAACPGHCSTNPPGLCTAAPTRCADTTMSPTCPNLVANCAISMVADNCPLSCGTCTVPSGIGKTANLCVASSGSPTPSSPTPSSPTPSSPSPSTTTTTMASTTTTAMATTMAAVSTVVTLAGLDFTKVTTTMKATLITNIKNAFLASLTGYSAADITVVLSAGSVKATVTITPKTGSTTAALTTSMTSQKATTESAVLTNVKAISGLDAAFQTGMSLSDVTATSTAPSAATTKGTTSGAASVGMIPVALMAMFIATLLAIKP